MPLKIISDKIFPSQFFWGCATSAHQVEGGLINDWSQWEQSEKRLEDLKNKQQDPLDFISGAASNSYIENNADIKCLKDLNCNSYRFSVDWSLIDNFEWAEGFKPRFGLYEVNFQTYERVARSSAEFYADICKNNRI